MAQGFAQSNEPELGKISRVHRIRIVPTPMDTWGRGKKMMICKFDDLKESDPVQPKERNCIG
jgi:hypothetical protein